MATSLLVDVMADDDIPITLTPTMRAGRRRTAAIAPREVWGVLGGLGPLASAEFLRTIYDQAAFSAEQQAPHVVLISDPTFPDRTASLEEGQAQALRRRLADGLEQLLGLGATRIVVCCVTIHSVLDELPPRLRDPVISLVDVAMNAVSDDPARRHLLLCSNGARRARVFERHPLWPYGTVVQPGDEDQAMVHRLIYAVKQHAAPASLRAPIERLLAAYGADTFVAGCTELHLVANDWAAGGRHCIDPLRILSARIAGAQRPLAVDRRPGMRPGVYEEAI